MQTFDLKTPIDFWIGDALQFLQQTMQCFDVIILDAERSEYLSYWQYLPQHVKPRGMIVIDRVISHAREVSEFISAIKSDTNFVMSHLAIGAGLGVLVKQA